jgi:hypothetical protein
MSGNPLYCFGKLWRLRDGIGLEVFVLCDGAVLIGPETQRLGDQSPSKKTEGHTLLSCRSVQFSIRASR